MTFTIVWNKATYYVTVELDGTIIEVLVEQPTGTTPVRTNPSALPNWIIDRILEWNRDLNTPQQ